MDIKIVNKSAIEHECNALIVNIFEGVKIPGGATGAVDNAIHGIISRLISEEEITGKLMETTLIYTDGMIRPDRVLVMGLGKSEDFGAREIRMVSGAAVRYLQNKGVKKVASIVHGAGIGGLDPTEAAQAMVEGALIGAYQSDFYKTPSSKKAIETFDIVEFDVDKIPSIESGMNLGKIMGEAVNNARNLGNEPSSVVTPEFLAEYTKVIANYAGLTYEEIDSWKMLELGMNAIISVGKGSANEPKLLSLKYTVGENRPTLALVGKAVTFDSGGISLKPSAGMHGMKFDMAGGAAVIEAMRVIGELKPNINVIGLVPCVENMPDGAAYKPGDIIRCMNGKTVEITTTDAEGRLILADSISYAVEQGADYIVDIATLTGACVVSLGNDITGIMGNDRKFIEVMKKTAEITGERVWELPLPADYMHLLKSSYADIRNAGERPAGAIQGGLFIQEFVNEVPWIHMDIGGTADFSSGSGPADGSKYMAMGATGMGVRTLSTLAFELGKIIK